MAHFGPLKMEREKGNDQSDQDKVAEKSPPQLWWARGWNGSNLVALGASLIRSHDGLTVESEFLQLLTQATQGPSFMRNPIPKDRAGHFETSVCDMPSRKTVG